MSRIGTARPSSPATKPLRNAGETTLWWDLRMGIKVAPGHRTGYPFDRLRPAPHSRAA
ncbi:hypothetical protein [Mycolicibacterium wolinskyi]|uniref:hypothetical protein n=1 Tax=Mycolicibacterium wolinskyi TaxID=59750 RepID=UPI000A3FD3D6|nr:hypothetical protein [Mycolicibacterium wolinskyi]